MAFPDSFVEEVRRTQGANGVVDLLVTSRCNDTQTGSSQWLVYAGACGTSP